MVRVITRFIFLSLTINFCNRNKQTVHNELPPANDRAQTNYTNIEEIPVPAGYVRETVEKDSFGSWLRQVKLKKDSRVYLYDGRLKNNQSTHFAVLDIPVGNKNLQQCADAILRLQAEYFFSLSNIDAIHFKATDGTRLSFVAWLQGERYKLVGNKLLTYRSGVSVNNKRIQLEQFLEVVFTYCRTISLDKSTRPVHDFSKMQIGDIFIKAGSPGHAMIVADVAKNSRGEKIFMLAQGFMPAQDIHIVKNLTDEEMSPWYRVTGDQKICTPQWIFSRDQLKRW